MPKLNKKKAKSVEAAESSGFSIIPGGVYVSELTKVEVHPSPAGNADVWWAFFKVVEDGDHEGHELLGFVSLSDKAEFKMKEFFDAFGEPADTDTDDLLGEEIRLAVSVITAQKGKRQGQEINSVEEFLPLDGKGTGGEDAEDEPF